MAMAQRPSAHRLVTVYQMHITSRPALYSSIVSFRRPSARLLLLTKDASLFHGRTERLEGREGSGDGVVCARAL